MQSPFKSESGAPIGLVNQIITLFRLEDATKEAFIDLVTSCVPSDVDFNEEYESVVNFHKQADSQKLFHAYEALYNLVESKRATERAMKEGNAQIIKAQLEEIAKYSYELEEQPKEMMALTEQQTTDLQTYLDKLKEYERVFSETS